MCENCEKARKTAEKFRKMMNAVPQQSRILAVACVILNELEWWADYPRNVHPDHIWEVLDMLLVNECNSRSELLQAELVPNGQDDNTTRH